ncbi:MAG: hypothetical protein V1856_01775 [Candidatus Liptonbacteria bacterium]
MSDFFNQSPSTGNSGQENHYTGFGRAPGAANNSSGPVLPPPPPAAGAELEIRTMRSDLEQMGGQANAFGNLTFSAPPPEVAVQTVQAPARIDPYATPNSKVIMILWMFVGIGVAGLLFAAGYFLLPKITAKQESGQISTSGGQTAAVPAPPAISASTTYLGYHSFAKIPTDGKFNIILNGDANRQNFVMSVLDQVGRGNASSALNQFTEIIIRNQEGQALPWGSYLKMVNAGLLSPDIWQEYFEQGFNMYLLRNERGAWPVYVLKHKPDQNRLVSEKDLSEIEKNSGELVKLFFSAPGEEMTRFETKQVYGEPARVLTYGNPGARLVYGWVDSQYFLISTSLESFEEAGRRL